MGVGLFTYNLKAVNIISVDLNWSPSKTARIAVAIADKNGNVRAVIGGLCDSELLCLINETHLKKSTHSLILLDIPIEECKYLGGRYFRPVDLALIRNGFPLLPSSNAGQRGRLLKKRIQTVASKNTRIYEIYPYAVYKFLSYISQKGALSSVGATLAVARNNGTDTRPAPTLLDGQFRTFWPPKYKREHNRRIRVKNMRYLFSLLTNPQIGLAFSSPLQAPSISENLSALADKYDACLGAVVGIHLANKSPFAKIAGNKDSGEILLLADGWLVKNLKRTNIKIR